MAYYPNALMPLTVKLDFSGSSGFSGSNLISAADYNKHDQELLAIEQFLGLQGAFPRLGLNKDISRDDGATNSGGAAATSQTSPDPAQGLLAANGGANLLNQIALLTDQLNVFVDGGLASSSGVVQTGQRIIFSDDAFMCFLTGVPAQGDTTINVNSTAGFPASGVISILNDVQQAVVPGAGATTGSTRGMLTENVYGGLSNVEWIQYSGKNSTQFLNCQRGHLGSYAGPHSGSFDQVRVTGATANNLKNFCVNLSYGVTICQRQNPSWRYRNLYSFPLLSLTGTLQQLERAVQLGAGQFRIFPTFNQADFNVAAAVAQSIGIAQFTSKGAMFFQTALGGVPQGQLRTVEADEFVQTCISKGIVHLTQGPGDFAVAGLGIPVICGRMAVNYSLADITRSDTGVMNAFQVIQTADARAVVTILKTTNTDETLQGVLAYETFLVASPRSSAEASQG